MSIDPQHRFEAHFTREIHHVADETKPVIFVDIGAVTVDESRLAAFVSARNCLSSHWCCPLDGVEAAGVPPPLT